MPEKSPNSLRRFFLSPEKKIGSRFRITDEALHHLRNVCRFSAGDELEILTGENEAYHCKLESVNKQDAFANILSHRNIPTPPPPYIHLAISMPRFSTFDTILEKSVELGVSNVLPFVSEYSFFTKNPETLAEKQERWEKIVIAATEQSGRGELLTISPCSTLENVLQKFQKESTNAGIFAFEGTGKLSLQQSLEKIRAQRPQNLWLFVGSEGGFSESEVDRFRQAKLPPTSLGNRILRVETACLALTSIVQHELGHL